MFKVSVKFLHYYKHVKNCILTNMNKSMTRHRSLFVPKIKKRIGSVRDGKSRWQFLISPLYISPNHCIFGSFLLHRFLMSKEFLILYGSQTNQSESIADQIYAKCIDMKLDPRVCRMDEVDKEVSQKF